MWRAVNALTRNKRSSTNKFPSQLTPNVLNDFFVSVADRTLEQVQCTFSNGTNYDIPNQLQDFCNRQNPSKIPFSIPLLSVLEVGKLISKLDSKKISGS